MLNVMPVTKVCCKCKVEKKVVDCFYYKWNNLGKTISSYCKECERSYSYCSYKEFRQKCLSYKGNVCERCGYNETPEILFIVPTVEVKSKFTEEIKEALDKSKLLCPNCYAISKREIVTKEVTQSE